MHVSNATYMITFEVPRCITESTHNAIQYSLIQAATDHSVIKFKYKRLGGKADHNITKYHSLAAEPTIT